MAKRPQMFRRLGRTAVSAGNTVTIDIPNAHILAALEIAITGTVGVSAGGVTVVDATTGPIKLIKRAQLRLDGSTVPLSVRGEFLDLWSHIDRPGSERKVSSSTADDGTWNAVLRWELAQSEVNLTGAIKLSNYGSVQLEIEFDAITVIATGTGVAFTGNVEAWGELYDESLPIAFDDSVMHTLTEHFVPVNASGDNPITIARGRALERLIVIAENNALFADNLVDSITLRLGQGFEPYYRTALMAQAYLARNYGGDDMPTSGVHVFDFRRAGDRDVIPLGDPQAAPYPELIAAVSSTPALTNAKLHVLREELERVEGRLARAA